MPKEVQNEGRKIELSNRQREILQVAIEILASEGYAKLTLRALARNSGMKLGALQYHFRTWEDMLRALARHIADVYRESFEARYPGDELPSLEDLVRLDLDEIADDRLQADKLFPQLWAMAQVEPVMAELMDGLYARYLGYWETYLAKIGSPTPRADGLVLMSMLEGTTLFVGRDCRWAAEAAAVSDAVLVFVQARYGKRALRQRQALREEKEKQ